MFEMTEIQEIYMSRSFRMEGSRAVDNGPHTIVLLKNNGVECSCGDSDRNLRIEWEDIKLIDVWQGDFTNIWHTRVYFTANGTKKIADLTTLNSPYERDAICSCDDYHG